MADLVLLVQAGIGYIELPIIESCQMTAGWVWLQTSQCLFDCFDRLRR